MNYLYSNELIGYVDLAGFNKSWAKNVPQIIRYRVTGVRRFSIVQFYKGFPKQPTVISKEPHTLLAHHLLSDVVQSV